MVSVESPVLALVLVSNMEETSNKNWMYSVSQFLIANNFGHCASIAEAIPSSQGFIADLENILYVLTTWLARINSNIAPSGRRRNKLRLYKTFKQNYSVENYCKIIILVRHRAAFSKFRCDVAPIRIETVRIRLTSPCIEDPLAPHFYIVKLGFTRVYISLLFHTNRFILSTILSSMCIIF